MTTELQAVTPVAPTEPADLGVTTLTPSPLREFVTEFVPRRATLAVVSRGDDALLAVGRRAWHFPRHPDGGYLGYHPGDSLAAIACLESARAQGADFLLVPTASRWWLDHYDEFARHLAQHYRRVAADEPGDLFDLRRRPTPTTGLGSLPDLLARAESALGRPPSLLDCWSGAGLAGAYPRVAVFEPPDTEPDLPYLDGTFDIVVVAEGSDALDEALRVGRVVVAAGNPGRSRTGVHWRVVHDAGTEEHALPAATIVIPCYDGWGITETCLRTVHETLPPGVGHEVLVVDDASSDRTAAGLQRLARTFPELHVVRNWENRGFIESCNLGAQLASNELIVFLNNDTVPLPGWLEPLLATLADPGVGLAGGKLLYPDGILQEAGGVVFSDAGGANFGRGSEKPGAPLFSYQRPVDYCSGALLAVRKSDFLGLGGFDRRYRPAYYEDTDLAFSTRAGGRSVLFNPESVVIHLEGASSGTDPTAGTKAYQARNRHQFARKWRDALADQPPPPGRFTPETWFLLAGGGSRP